MNKEAITLPEKENGFQEVSNTNSATSKLLGGLKICPSTIDRIINNFNKILPQYAIKEK